MSRYSGHGGYAVFVYLDNYYVIHNITNEPSYMAKVVENTDSRNGGWTSGVAKVAQAMANFEVNDDSTAALDLSGLPIGVSGTLFIRRGELERFDRIVGAIWGGVSRTNDNMEGGTPRTRLQFQHGVATTWLAKSALPAGLQSFLVSEGLLTA